MSIQNFEKLFRPRSVALIGASGQRGSVGAVLARNLRRAGFDGELLLVNPAFDKPGREIRASRHREPAAPARSRNHRNPAQTVPGLVAELGARGTRAAS